MSELTPVAVLAVALGGALVVALVEQLVAGYVPAPGAVLRRSLAVFDEPIQRPTTYDGWLFHGAPALLVVGAVTALAMVPWTPGLRGIDLQSGAIFFAGALAYVTPAVFMAGWGAGSPLAVLGGFRFVALMLAYAMPLAMVITAVAAPAGSLRPVDIVDVQHAVPMALAQPLAALLWLPAVMAVCFLPPFDLPQAPGELGGGAFSRYRGLEAGLVSLAQRILVVAVSGMTAALFLGGWHGPLLPDAVWMAVKTLGVAALILWLGRRVPRMEIDRLLSFAWKVAIPLAIAAIVYAGPLTLLAYR
ncbi:MAG TPA: complex I subunit 1 family protein [Solirubrobacteraceae bacterium]|nr:complex I subunit 1 family protein [Solirubrobacteraceae bacterium]